MSINFIKSVDKFQEKLEKHKNQLPKLSITKKDGDTATPYYLIVIHAMSVKQQIDPTGNYPCWVFTARIRRCHARRAKTRIEREAVKGNRHYECATIYDFFDDYETVCGKWLTELLFFRDLKIEQADVVLPPRLTRYIADNARYKCNATRLRLTLNPSEPDTGLVDWWLSKMITPVDFSDNPKYLHIYPTNNRLIIKDNEVFKAIDRVQIQGASDIDAQTLFQFGGSFFYYKRIPREWSLSDEEIQQLFTYLNGLTISRRIYLEWGDLRKSEQFIQFLKDKYNDFTVENPHFLRKNSSFEFYFKMEKNRTVIGNFLTLDFVNVRDLYEISNEF